MKLPSYPLLQGLEILIYPPRNGDSHSDIIIFTFSLFAAFIIHLEPPLTWSSERRSPIHNLGVRVLQVQHRRRRPSGELHVPSRKPNLSPHIIFNNAQEIPETVIMKPISLIIHLTTNVDVPVHVGLCDLALLFTLQAHSFILIDR